MFPEAELILSIDEMNYDDQGAQMCWKRSQPCIKSGFMTAVRVRARGYAHNKKTEGALRLPVPPSFISTRVSHTSERYRDIEV